MLKIHVGLSLSVRVLSLGCDLSQNRFNCKTVLPFTWPKWACVCNTFFSTVWVLVLSKMQFCINFAQENCANTFFTGNVSQDRYLSFSTLAAKEPGIMDALQWRLKLYLSAEGLHILSSRSDTAISLPRFFLAYWVLSPIKSQIISPQAFPWTKIATSALESSGR